MPLSGSSVLGMAPPSAPRIAAELRSEFDRAMLERFGTQPQPDPVLTTLFHLVAERVGRVYEEAEHLFPEAVLDDLVRGLGLPGRSARPARAVVEFSEIGSREMVEPGFPLIGFSANGGAVPFTPERPLQLAPVRLAFAGVCERGCLTVVPGARGPGGRVPLPRASTPTAHTGMAPCLLLAFDADPDHLSGLGLFLDCGGAPGAAVESVREGCWQLLDAWGRVTEPGTLRGVHGRSGTRQLFWRGRPGSAASGLSGDVPGSVLPGRELVAFPEIPEAMRARSLPPPGISTVLPAVLPGDHAQLLAHPHAWVQLALPAGATGLAEALERVVVNCVTVANLETIRERVELPGGASVAPLRPEGRSDRPLVRVLGVTGERGRRYADESDGGEPSEQGRFRVRPDRVEVTAATDRGGRPDRHAVLRLLICDGERANGLAPGEIRRIAGRLANATAQVRSLTTTSGGCAPPPYGSGRLRLAELLRTRGRVLTAADYEIAARAFDPRVRSARVENAVRRTAEGVRRITCVRIDVDAAGCEPVTVETLRASLEERLGSLAPFGEAVGVEVAGEERSC